MGYWPDTVSLLAHWLRTEGCPEYAFPLEKQLQGHSPEVTAVAEVAILDALWACMPRLVNDPPQCLTADQTRQFIELRDQALHSVRCWRQKLKRRLAATRQAEARVGLLLQEMAGADDTPEPPSDPPPLDLSQPLKIKRGDRELCVSRLPQWKVIEILAPGGRPAELVPRENVIRHVYDLPGDAGAHRIKAKVPALRGMCNRLNDKLHGSIKASIKNGLGMRLVLH